MQKPSILGFLLVAALAVAGTGGYYLGWTNASTHLAAPSADATANSSHAATGGATKGKASPASVAASLDALLKANGAPTADALAKFLQSLRPEDYAATLTYLQNAGASVQRDAILNGLIAAWAQRDPASFLAVSGTLTVPRLREQGIDAALKTLATKDPQAALQWLKDNPGTASTMAARDRFAAAIAGFAVADPKGAFDAVAALGEDNFRDKQLKSDAFKALSDSLAAQGRYEDALKLFGDLPAGETRNDAFTRLAESWAASSPQDASKWIATLTDPAERTRLGGRVAEAWAANDPAAAALWAAQLDSQSFDPNTKGMKMNDNGVLLANAIAGWARYDLDAPAEFLNQLPPSPSKDRAVAIFAMRAASEDAEGAMQWIGTISDPTMRQSVIMPMAIQMYLQDPAGYQNFMATTTLVDDNTKQMMSRIATPQLMQGMKAMNAMMGSGSSGGGNSDFMSKIFESALTKSSSEMKDMGMDKMGPPGAVPAVDAGAADAQPGQ